jgi:hypothetical protein
MKNLYIKNDQENTPLNLVISTEETCKTLLPHPRDCSALALYPRVQAVRRLPSVSSGENRSIKRIFNPLKTKRICFI